MKMEMLTETKTRVIPMVMTATTCDNNGDLNGNLNNGTANRIGDGNLNNGIANGNNNGNVNNDDFNGMLNGNKNGKIKYANNVTLSSLLQIYF
ncbi:4229_t:CDS:2 [Ambispora gerdemannii]|uniref:4229_t:CDS:1 n=1 Tax=Ambispora gerdemannii TaxID=144530 RepID=A0A9N9G3Y8_9GLOM|nr:4229_t:CDS:2 [Ambispora gerdemannii]